MATVQVYFRKDAKELELYLKERPEHVYSSILICDDTEAHKEFLETQNIHGKTRGNQAIHAIQSWSPKESKKLTLDEIQEIGRELTKKSYPGHEALIVTHFDKNHLHNHLMINPVHSETGKRIYNKKEERFRVRDISDDILRQHGLEVIIPKKRERRVNSKVLQIEKSGRFSYNIDIENKALFASRYARNFQEHILIMKDFGIETKVQNKNTSYRHPKQQRFKRGAKLNDELTNVALNSKFATNKEKYPNNQILNIIKTDPEYSKLKATTIQMKNKKGQKLYLAKTVNEYKHIKNEKFEGVVLINEKGERFFVNKHDKQFSEFLKSTNQFNRNFIDNTSDIKIFKKANKLMAKSTDGKQIWIDKNIDPEIFKTYKQQEHFTIKNFTHYYINSTYYKNLYSTNLKDKQSYQKIDALNIDQLLKDNKNQIKNLKIIEHQYDTDIFSNLIKKHTNIKISFQKTIEETLSR